MSRAALLHEMPPIPLREAVLTAEVETLRRELRGARQMLAALLQRYCGGAARLAWQDFTNVDRLELTRDDDVDQQAFTLRVRGKAAC